MEKANYNTATSTGTRVAERPDKPFYVEVTVIHPEGREPRETWYTVVTYAKRGKDAEAEAFRLARQAHPKAEKIEHFLTRSGTSLDERKAQKIRQEMIDGTWEGWTFG